jgi:hypothetical protein
MADLMTHDALAADLAGHLRTDTRMTWCDIQLGPSGSARPDVLTIDKSFVRPNITVYECKVTRSDYMADVTAGKWQSYLKFAGAVYFAAPAGLLKPSEIPERCGLMVRHDSGTWRAARRAVRDPREMPFAAMLKLLIDGVEREGPVYRQKRFEYDRFSKRFGVEAARWVMDAATVQNRIATAQTRAKGILALAESDAARIRKQAQDNAPRLWRQLCEVLRLPVDSGEFDVRDAIARVRRSVGGDVENLLRVAEGIESQVRVLRALAQQARTDAEANHAANL